MKKTLFAAAAAAALSASFATSASACTGDACVAPPTWAVNIGGFNTGYGEATFGGGDGYSVIAKQGYSMGTLTMDAGGQLCGPDCSNTGFTANLSMGEMITMESMVEGNEAGVPTYVSNGGFINLGGFIDIQKAMFESN